MTEFEIAQIAQKIMSHTSYKDIKVYAEIVEMVKKAHGVGEQPAVDICTLYKVTCKEEAMRLHKKVLADELSYEIDTYIPSQPGYKDAGLKLATKEYWRGYKEGHDNGFEQGKKHGRESGYKKGFEEGKKSLPGALIYKQGDCLCRHATLQSCPIHSPQQFKYGSGESL